MSGPIIELGYMGLSVSNADAWKNFAGKIMGLEISDEGEGDRFYLRMDEWHHRFVVHVDGQDDLAYMGWRVAGRQELDQAARLLEANGVEVTFGSPEEAAERRVLGLLKLQDPGGNPTEIFYGPQVDAHRPFHPGRPMHGRFVTGAQGMGHSILRQSDDDAAYAFYEMLGFRGDVEYHLPLPNGMTAKPIFMHCNERDHSVAFGMGPMPKRINHFMFEYTDLRDFGRTHDLIRKEGTDVALALGMHSNDRALTFYCANPSGWLWEPSWNGRPSSDLQEYYVSDILGHDNEAEGYGMDLRLKS
ncbi:2,3-dihydroxybiphenyl 1,2-dioxygenase [Sphingobium algorifonticola]|uniref:2,3-dihydroxybiphenyl 1,2-dioxygenase n=2 Tax=Sphingobium algorifonticola TaxID=2008318 RepID=A0A437J460_9SPHN|nr:VOC family protein [Sphingobium algorifonticola]RVT39400.1 2,3-dihydroxybiphenyl 1,2-dioxygenase [Sphingobium algorifonticola]